MDMKNKAASAGVGLATLAAIGGAGFVAAGSASACGPVHCGAGWATQYVHNSAHYGSYSSCMTNRNGFVARVNKEPWRGYTHYVGSCSYNYSGHYWTYGHVTYERNMLGKLDGNDRTIKVWMPAQ